MSYSNFRWLIERITQLKSHERGGDAANLLI